MLQLALGFDHRESNEKGFWESVTSWECYFIFISETESQANQCQMNTTKNPRRALTKGRRNPSGTTTPPRGWELAIMIASIGSMHCSGKGSPRNMVKWLTFGTYLGASLFGPFGLNGMTKCFTKYNGTSPRSCTRFGTNSSFTPSRLGKRVLAQIKISSFSAVAMLQGFDKTWDARKVLCRRHNLHIAWNWKRQRR